MQKIRKILRAVSEKTVLPTNQLLPTTPILWDLADAGPKNKKSIKGIKMFENTFLYTAYADDSTFSWKDKNSIKELLNTINYFSSLTGLKPYLSKCELAGTGVLKRVKVAICRIK